MKLGICYMVFDGEELLEFAIKPIRHIVDFIAVTYQTTSYFGNKNDTNILEYLTHLQSLGLIDQLIYFEPNLSLPPKDNELKLRQIGLEASRNANCSHHISLDVDEFFVADQLNYAKQEICKADYDFSIMPYNVYYKKPTYQLMPHFKYSCTFIHPVSNEYTQSIKYPEFPFRVESTRRLINYSKYRVFTREECVCHHMSYVRKNMMKKWCNNDNSRVMKISDFMKQFQEHKLGERITLLLPDYLNRKTIEVDNIFNIPIWE